MTDSQAALPSRDSIWRRYWRSPSGQIGGALLLLLFLTALLGPLVVDSPREQNVQERFQRPSLTHPFGTDELGRDILARVVHGARISLTAAVVAVAIGLLIGTVLGLIAGFFDGAASTVIMALMDLMLALPAILLAITIGARLGPGLGSAMLAAGFVGLPGYARLARGSTLSVRKQEYVEAARASGASSGRIMFHHVLPNVAAPLIVQATIGVGNAILLVSALGYLGLGAQPPTPEWGRMLSDAQKYILNATYIGIFPGIAIALTVIGFSLAGDGLRDATEYR
jgi:peptide/nickel transport system permease protein